MAVATAVAELRKNAKEAYPVGAACDTADNVSLLTQTIRIKCDLLRHRKFQRLRFRNDMRNAYAIRHLERAAGFSRQDTVEAERVRYMERILEYYVPNLSFDIQSLRRTADELKSKQRPSESDAPSTRIDVDELEDLAIDDEDFTIKALPDNTTRKLLIPLLFLGLANRSRIFGRVLLSEFLDENQAENRRVDEDDGPGGIPSVFFSRYLADPRRRRQTQNRSRNAGVPRCCTPGRAQCPHPSRAFRLHTWPTFWSRSSSNTRKPTISMWRRIGCVTS